MAGRHRLWPVLLGLLLLAGALGLLLWLNGSVPMPARPENLAGSEQAGNRHSGGPLSSEKEGAGPRTAEANASAPVEGQPTTQGRRLFFIHCHDTQGRDVVGARIAIQGSYALPNGPAHAVTGSNGIAEVELERWGGLNVSADDPQWWGDAEFNAPKATRRGELMLRPCASFEIWAQTDEGVPCFGYGSLSFGIWRETDWVDERQPMLLCKEVDENLDENRYRWSDSLYFDGKGPIKVTRVPNDNNVMVFIDPEIMGFSQFYKLIPASSMVEGARITITVPRDPKCKEGLIEVDLSAYQPRYDTDTVEIEDCHFFRIWRQGCFRPIGNGVWRSLPMDARPDSNVYFLRLVVNEQDVIWESPRVVVRENETVRVKYEPRQVCRVTVRVVDDKGAPLAGAVLTRNTTSYVSWAMEIPDAGAARTNADGQATINVSAGKCDLMVEAQGFEPHRFTVDLAEGTQHREPDIYLSPAVGRIEIKLEGMRKDQSYSVMLIQPGGLAAFMQEEVSGDSCVFERLPLREYIVAVIAGRGGTPATENVVLSKGAENVTLKFDVSNLKED